MKPISNEIAVSVFYALVVDKTRHQSTPKVSGNKIPTCRKRTLEGDCEI